VVWYGHDGAREWYRVPRGHDPWHVIGDRGGLLLFVIVGRFVTFVHRLCLLGCKTQHQTAVGTCLVQQLVASGWQCNPPFETAVGDLQSMHACRVAVHWEPPDRGHGNHAVLDANLNVLWRYPRQRDGDLYF